MTKQAHSVNEFCEAHGICRGTLYNLWRSGDGPRFMQVRGRRLISAEAAADWRSDMEANVARDKPEAA